MTVRLHAALVIALLATSWSTAAHAHDLWESNGLARNPSAPNDLVLRTNRGAAFSRDGGTTWHFLCRAALDNFTPAIGVTTDARALMGNFYGLSSATMDGCDSQEVSTPMSGLWVSDLQRDPTQASAWYATTSRGQAANGLFRSDDDGQTWSVLGERETGPFFKQVRVTPDGQRIYMAVAQYVPPDDNGEGERVDYSLRYTDDRGENWTSFPIETAPDDKEMVLLGIDPENPDRVFIGIHVCREDSNSCFDPARGKRDDSVLVSNDRGATWETLFEVEEIASFEINDEHIWVGNWWGGLWRMNADGSDPVLLHQYLKAGCLEATDEGLLVCGTDVFGFMLARSTDNGTTLTPIVTSANILGDPVCGPSDQDGGLNIAAACRQEWQDLCGESFFDDPNPPMECNGFIDAGVKGDAGGGIDAGNRPGSARGGGCECSVPGNAPVTGGFGFLLLVGTALTFRSRRMRTQHPTRG